MRDPSSFALDRQFIAEIVCSFLSKFTLLKIHLTVLSLTMMLAIMSLSTIHCL